MKNPKSIPEKFKSLVKSRESQVQRKLRTEKLKSRESQFQRKSSPEKWISSRNVRKSAVLHTSLMSFSTILSIKTLSEWPWTRKQSLAKWRGLLWIHARLTSKLLTSLKMMIRSLNLSGNNCHRNPFQVSPFFITNYIWDLIAAGTDPSWSKLAL